MTAKYRKKLIEVALPLEAINVASAREKSIRHGHPSTLHLWWARRPLAACRAVLFASLVNDPDDDPMYGINEDTAATERANLFNLIEELVQWENSNEPRVINAARLEIARSIAANKVADGELKDDTPLVANAPELPEEQAKYLPEPPPEYTPKDVRFKMPGLKPAQVNHFLAHYAPPVLDPFAGGGSIPLEAQRLGLRAYASDLNPVPVLINKALIEIPPKFAGQPPVNPDAKKGKLKSEVWNGAEGLADDVRYYGKWMRDEAEKRIGHLYPKVKITQEMVDDGRPDLEPYVGQELTIIAWLWTHSVTSPNPAAHREHVPLSSTFWLCRKKGREAYVLPRFSKDRKSFEFGVNLGKPSSEDVGKVDAGTKLSRGCNFRCLLSDQPIPEQHVKDEGMAGRLSQILMAVVAEGSRERIYLSPKWFDNPGGNIKTPDISDIAAPIAHDKRALWCLLYGFTHFDKLYLPRQLSGLTFFCQLLEELKETIAKRSSQQYARALSTYLAFAISKASSRSCKLAIWEPGMGRLAGALGRQALPMQWNFAETNPIAGAGGDIAGTAKSVSEVLDGLIDGIAGIVEHRDARAEIPIAGIGISTDPPYYDNIGYADLSDFFYVWLRRTLRTDYPDVLSTLLSPKDSELIASPYRHDGSKSKAKEFFEEGLSVAIGQMKRAVTDEIPLTVFYAFKQIETELDGAASTGWETFLTGLIEHGFSVVGTWPIRTEDTNSLKRNVSALASSIVLSCRMRGDRASMVTRRDFVEKLRSELPSAIKHLQLGNVAPVDLAQASIGPGMAVFSRYSKVVNADGSPMSVREALQLINQVLDESLAEQESDFDAETRFALKWFEQFGMSDGPYGDAETLSKAMAVAVDGIREAGIVASKAGKVRLLKRDELADDWDPATDPRLTLWEVTQYLIRALENEGETGAADLLRRVGQEKGDIARELAYRLYQTCERKSLAKEAGSYNALVVSWPEISKLARQQRQQVSATLPGMEDDQ